jgi:hypothetical protein
MSFESPGFRVIFPVIAASPGALALDDDCAVQVP